MFESLVHPIIRKMLPLIPRVPAIIESTKIKTDRSGAPPKTIIRKIDPVKTKSANPRYNNIDDIGPSILLVAQLITKEKIPLINVNPIRSGFRRT